VADSPAEHDPETTTLGEHAAAMADPGSARAALDRGRFLSGVTVGLGGLMSAVIAVPALGFVLAPAFETPPHWDVDLGPASLYPVDKSNPFHVVTFTRSPTTHNLGEIERRVVFIRNDGADKFTAIANTCMHLGCPVRAFGSAGFGCPCHGGQYDAEGRRTAGPPVRPLNRYDTKVEKGHLLLGTLYAMDDSLHKHQLKAPGQPVTGLLSFLYPPAPQ
jgi:menaquinol-cytochrome c reductase iron-sulfur subunit